MKDKVKATLASASGGSARNSLGGLKWWWRRAVLRAMVLDDRARRWQTLILA
jgi:hypothetical protein